MKKVLIIAGTAFMVVVVLGGLGAAYIFLGCQDRGMTADGHMVPPASVRNAPVAPTFKAGHGDSPVANQQPADYQLPTDFKLPTDLDIAAPQVPAGISAPAEGQKG